MSTIDPDVWKDCPSCSGAGKKPSKYGQVTCGQCSGKGAVPRYGTKDPTWGPRQ